MLAYFINKKEQIIDLSKSPVKNLGCFEVHSIPKGRRNPEMKNRYF